MLLTVSHARADSWLVVNSQATPQSFSLDNIRTLTFADDKLVVNTYDAAAAASFNLADLTTRMPSRQLPSRAKECSAMPTATSTWKGLATSTPPSTPSAATV